jgi:thymidylate synthase
MPLFQEKKYPVFQGNKEASIGFCTVWNQADVAIKATPELLEKAALIGTLYARQGVNVILRNLALNPHIRTLVLWGHGPLSNTPFGTGGTDILKALWKDGVDDESMVIGTSFSLEQEIDLDIVRKIVSSVELKNVSKLDLRSAVADLKPAPALPYMDAVEFAPPVPQEIATLPSEKIGFTVHGNTVLETWRKLVFHIMRYGTVKGSQYGMEQKELLSAQWVIHNEEGIFPKDIPDDWPADLRETIGVTESSIGEYHDIFMKGDTKEGVAYTYGSRLRNWTLGDKQIDQVKESLIGNLLNSPDSRRAVATTLIPMQDVTSKTPPCIITVQCIQSEGKLCMIASFRSHDVFKAAIPNAFGLLAMHHEVAEATGFERGSLCIQSHSAHIYEADFEHADKLINCAYLERDPKKVFDAMFSDKRGSLIIRVDEHEIVAEHHTGDGALIAEYRGGSAHELTLKLGHLNIISQVSHALDIGMELQKAEHAMKLGIGYMQDRPLKFGVRETV